MSSALITAAGPEAYRARVVGFRPLLPADLSHSPLLGILAVIMGAGTASLAARLLTLGAADLRGHVGMGVDEGAWIGTAFNAATMFIGPLTVYFGAILGARRVLLVCSGLFALASASLPFVHSYGLLMILLAIAGSSSGTFYPLTMGFALQNIPLRYLALTLGLYATAIEGALNFAPSLYGFYRDHLSWTWMFWTAVVVMPMMAVCVYKGIAAPPRRAPSAEKPSFAGLLYVSAGLALLFAALDQGQRLDWWRSGVFTALFASGAFLLACAIVRRLRAPSLLVDLPYLRQWDILILAGALFMFRFVLLATALVIPLSLSFRGLDPAQFGPAVLWTAVAELSLAVFAAYLLTKGLDSRLLMGLGFATIAAVCLLNARFTSAWAAENYFPTELLMAVGQSFAFVGLVSLLVLQVFFSGALDSPYRVLTFSAFFHTVRLFGGQVGTTVMSHFIAEQEKVHSYLVGLHVQPGDWVTSHTLTSLAAGLGAKSSGVSAAAGRAVGLVSGAVRQQAYALTFIDAFQLIAWASVVVLLAIATLRRPPLSLGEIGTMDRDLHDRAGS